MNKVRNSSHNVKKRVGKAGQDSVGMTEEQGVLYLREDDYVRFREDVEVGEVTDTLVAREEDEVSGVGDDSEDDFANWDFPEF